MKQSYELTIKKSLSLLPEEINSNLDDDNDLINDDILNEDLQLRVLGSKIPESSEYFYLKRKSISKFYIIKQQQKLFHLLNIFLKGLKYFNEIINQDISESNILNRYNYHSHRNSNDYYVWENKIQFENKMREIIGDKYFKDPILLRV